MATPYKLSPFSLSFGLLICFLVLFKQFLVESRFNNAWNSDQCQISDWSVIVVYWFFLGGRAISHIISLSVCPIQNGDTVRRFFLENINIFELLHHNIITLGGKLPVKAHDNTLIIHFGNWIESRLEHGMKTLALTLFDAFFLLRFVTLLINW